jgi:hypothetical protein
VGGLLSTLTNLDAALERMSSAASTDEGRRAQLVDLAESYGGIYRCGLDALYAADRQSLGAEQALVRVASDKRLLAETRERERRRKLRAELEQAGELAEAAEQAEAAARALREHTRAKLVRIAAEDDALRRRLAEFARKRKGSTRWSNCARVVRRSRSSDHGRLIKTGDVISPLRSLPL